MPGAAPTEPERRPVVTLLTDYGWRDEFAGVCRAVIAGICPRARVIDLTHGIPRHDVTGAALVLRNALPYLPVGVHVAIVDPGVGSERRALALELGAGHVLVGPDNGVLAPAAAEGGGIVRAADIGESRFRLEPVSATFHGRDVFAPVAARIAAGATVADAGAPVDPGGIVTPALPRAAVRDGALVAAVVHADGYGNLQLGAEESDLAAAGLLPGRPLEVRAAGRRVAGRRGLTFADVAPGALVLFLDAYRTPALAVNGGDAGALLGVAPGDPVSIRPA